MKKIDTKGFVMVETIVVAVFVISICTFLFANFLPLIGDYERVREYDTVNSKYKMHEIKKMILRDIDNNINLETIFKNLPSEEGFIKYSIIETKEGETTVISHELCNVLDSKKYCNKLLSENYLDVKDIIITSFKLSKIKSTINNLNDHRVLKEYIDYLPSYSKYGVRYNDYYRIIASFNDGTVANIEVQYEN